MSQMGSDGRGGGGLKADSRSGVLLRDGVWSERPGRNASKGKGR